MSLDVISFGCRLNASESEGIRQIAGAAGELDNTVIINSCAVTAEAVRQTRQTVRRLRRERPDTKIVVTGCAAQTDAAGFADMAEVNRVLGNAEKLEPGAWISTARVAVSDIMAQTRIAAPVIDGNRGLPRAFVQIQNGCDHRCTFCIIPYARGPSRSVPLDTIIDEARRLVARGCREIVLTGVDLTAYGADLAGAPSLGQIARRLLASVPELARLRLSSLDPSEIDEPLWALLGEEPRLMPHLHFSLQAGDDLILKRMKRRHSRAQAIAAARRARALRAEIAIGADLIAGFPTETEEMFRRSLDLVEECGVAFLHVFPYSVRPGTPAARMPQLDRALVRERAARLRAAGAATLGAELNSRIGSRSAVLVERPGLGRTEFYATVEFDGALPVGSVQPMRLVAARGRNLVGVPAS